MGGQTPAQQPRRGAVADAGGAPQGMACGGTERGEGRNRGHGGGKTGGHTGGCGKLGEGRGVSTYGFQGQIPGQGGDLAAGSPYHQGEEGLTVHQPRGGDVEGSGGNSKSPFHILHHLPRCPPWIQGRSRHGDRHP